MHPPPFHPLTPSTIATCGLRVPQQIITSKPLQFCSVQTANPIRPLSGEKILSQTDIEMSELRFSRFYHSSSQTAAEKRFAPGWQHSFSQHLVFNTSNAPVFVVRDNGNFVPLRQIATGVYTNTGGPSLKVEQTTAGYRVLLASGREEIYSADGQQLESIKGVDNYTKTFSYDANNRLSHIEVDTGQFITLTYSEENQLAALSDSAERTWNYLYDAQGNLEFVEYPDTTKLQYHYENVSYPHHVTGITDRREIRYATFPYDANGRAETSYLGTELGRVDVNYGTEGVQTVLNSLGLITEYHSVNQLNNIIQTKSVSKACETCTPKVIDYTYAPSTNHLLLKSENGKVTEYGGYGPKGNYSYKIEAAGTSQAQQTDYTYDARFQSKIASITQPSVFDGENKVTTYSYDDNAKITAMQIEGYRHDGTPISQTTSYQYEGPLGQISQIDGPREDVTDITQFTYHPDTFEAGDNRARLLSVTGPTGILQRNNIQHSKTGKVLSEERPNGLNVNNSYYQHSDLLESSTQTDQISGEAQTVYWTYLPTGEVETITQGYGSSVSTTMTLAYDEARRLVSITDGLGNQQQYQLDTEGNRIGETIKDPQGVLTQQIQRSFDAYSQIDQLITNAAITDYSYHIDGTLDDEKNGKDVITTYDYDTLQRLTKTTSDTSGINENETVYSYDAGNNLKTVTDGEGKTTQYLYDDFNKIIHQTSPDTGVTSFTYDKAGNQTSQTDARGITSHYSYDALNRLTQISYPDSSQNVTYYYDENDNSQNGIGRLTTIIDATGTTGYHYDVRGNLIQQSKQQDGITSTISYVYDAADRIEEISNPSGRKVNYSHNAAGQVTTVATTHNGVSQIIVEDMSYRPFGPLQSMTYGNGLNYQADYDLDYQLDKQTSGTVFDKDYTQDEVGNISLIDDMLDSSKSQTFGYDSLDRLSQAQGDYGDFQYSYDAIGNRLSKTVDGNNNNYSYATTSHQLETITGTQSRTYQYDTNGNMIDNGQYQFSYGDNNRLQHVQQNGTIVAQYQYNALGQRVKKQANGDTTYYHYNQAGKLIAETDPTGETTQAYLYVNNQPIALIGAANTNTEEIIIDNTDAEFSRIGTWAGSSTISGYWGVGYRYNAANDAPPAGEVIDNRENGFTRIGSWSLSSTEAGYWSTNYRYKAANDAPADGEVIDNTDSGFTITGSWKYSSTVAGHWGGGYRYQTVNSGATATWTPSVTPGQYEVYARWTSASKRIIDAQYTIHHSQGSNTVTVDQRQNGGNWQLLGTYTVDANSRIELSDASSGTGYVIADAIKLAPPGATPNTAIWTPAVTPGEYEIFSRWTAGGKRVSDAQYTIHHTTGQSTVVKDQTIGGGQWQSLGIYTVDGTSRVELSDASNDTGYLVADAIKLAPVAAEPNTATWAPQAAAGEYDVYTRWTSNSKRITDARYTIHYAGGSSTVTVNQQQNGGAWQLLGSYQLDQNSRIELTDQSNDTGYVVADAVRLVPKSVPSTGLVTYYIHSDHLSTPKLLTDENQNVSWRAEAEPFGSTTVTGQMEFNLRFPGQYFDLETGLYYNYYRYYDPSTGRYITSDPIGLDGGLNNYGYALQNPIVLSDPLGLYSETADDRRLGRVPTLLDFLYFTHKFTTTVIQQCTNDEKDDNKCKHLGTEAPPFRPKGWKICVSKCNGWGVRRWWPQEFPCQGQDGSSFFPARGFRERNPPPPRKVGTNPGKLPVQWSG